MDQPGRAPGTRLGRQVIENGWSTAVCFALAPLEAVFERGAVHARLAEGRARKAQCVVEIEIRHVIALVGRIRHEQGYVESRVEDPIPVCIQIE